MNAANLANMYAAYFPYYMNQFPGANPYASSAPAAAAYGHHHHQPPFAAPAMNKGYPMYPAGGAAAAAVAPSAAAPTTTVISSQTAQQQQGAPKPVAASTAGIYGAGGYNPYGVGQLQQQQLQQQQQQTMMDDGSMSAGQDAYNKYQAFLGANQQGNVASKSNDYTKVGA